MSALSTWRMPVDMFLHNYTQYHIITQSLSMYIANTGEEEFIRDLYRGVSSENAIQSHKDMKRHGLAWFVGLPDYLQHQVADITYWRYQGKVAKAIDHNTHIMKTLYKYGMANKGQGFYCLPLNDIWYDHIASGKKVYEGQLFEGQLKQIAPGDIIEFTRRSNKITMHCIVNARMEFPTYRRAMEKLGLCNVLPGVETIEDGVAVYRQWHTEADELKYGVMMLNISILRLPEASVELESHDVWEAEYSKAP